MNRLCTAFAVAALVMTGAAVRAAPPTVVPSPGYDARLQEQRKAASTSTSTVVQPVTPQRHHRKRRH
jgi:hypothetical protein